MALSSFQTKIIHIKVFFFTLFAIIFFCLFFIKQPSSQKKDPLTFPDANHKISFGFIKNLIKDPISTLPKRLLPSENKLRIKKIDLKGVRKRQFFKPLANKHQNSQKKINLLKINYTNNKTKILNICKKFEPQLESQIKEMKIYNVYLGKTSDYKKALEWLKAKFNNLNFVKNLSYGVYNDQINQSYVCFNSRLRDELPEKLLLVYFDEGTRKNTNNCYSLDALKSLGNGAKNMYIFWQDENHTKEQNFWQENFYTDLIYEKGSGYHSPSYLNINSIVLKKKDNNEVVAIFPIKCQIKAPISLYNYDLELRFPYYKYQYKGLFWKTRKIKRIQKIDLYAKQTGEKRTLYYEDKF